jgi:hypothetical protein
MLDFISGIVSALVTGIVVKLLEDYASYIPASYPNLRDKNWIVRYQNKHRQVEGDVEFTQQLFWKVKGIYSLKEAASDKRFKYAFNGKFLKRDELAIEFRPETMSDFTDQGYALLKIDPTHSFMKGTAISFDLKTSEPRQFTITLAVKNTI